jgi:hypothetical protein
MQIAKQLPATRSHRYRCYAFVPATNSEAWGRLTITQGKESTTYDVEEQIQEFPDPLRIFLLCNRLDGIYEVAVRDDGLAFCSGPFCGKHKSCKHRDAMLDLIRQGALPMPGDDYPYERDYLECAE